MKTQRILRKILALSLLLARTVALASDQEGNTKSREDIILEQLETVVKRRISGREVLSLETGTVKQLVIRKPGATKVHALRSSVSIKELGVVGDKHIGKKKPRKNITDEQWEFVLKAEAVSMIDSGIAKALGPFGLTGDNIIIEGLDFSAIRPRSLIVIHDPIGNVKVLMTQTNFPHLGCCYLTSRVGAKASARIFYGTQGAGFYKEDDLSRFKESVQKSIDTGLRGKKAWILMEGIISNGDRVTVIPEYNIEEHPILDNIEISREELLVKINDAVQKVEKIENLVFNEKRKKAGSMGNSMFNPNSTQIVNENSPFYMMLGSFSGFLPCPINFLSGKVHQD